MSLFWVATDGVSSTPSTRRGSVRAGCPRGTLSHVDDDHTFFYISVQRLDARDDLRGRRARGLLREIYFIVVVAAADHAGARERRGLAAVGRIARLAACASDEDPNARPAELEEPDPIPTAEDYYTEGTETLEGFRVLWMFRQVDYLSAIALFQSVIDNYPYSEYATLSELTLADIAFDSARRDARVDSRASDAAARLCSADAVSLK